MDSIFFPSDARTFQWPKPGGRHYGLRQADSIDVETTNHRPVDAVAHAAKILKDNLQIFNNFEEEIAPQAPRWMKRSRGLWESLAEAVRTRVSVRSYNCRKNARIRTLGGWCKDEASC